MSPWRVYGAGIVNGIAGGGTLVSFPVLLAVGVPALRANVTSTVGIFPGYLGGVAGFRREIADQKDRLRTLAPVAIAGAIAGSVLLLVTPSSAFSRAAPYLILVACALFASQPFLARRLELAGGRSRLFVAQGGVLRRVCLRGLFRRGARCASARCARDRDARPVGSHERDAIGDLTRRQHDRGRSFRSGSPRGLDLRRAPRGDEPGRRVRGRAVGAEGSGRPLCES